MGIFGFFKKDKIENENKSKPFYENKSNIERRDWFSKTRPWHKVDPNIIDALISKYNENPMLEVFVIASMENGLVKDYEEISNKHLPPEVACSFISGVLSTHGMIAYSQVDHMIKIQTTDESKLSKEYGNALNLLESSIIIDPNQIGAYPRLVILKGMLHKHDEAILFAKQGLAAIKRIRESDFPFHLSSIQEINNAPNHINQTETILLSVKTTGIAGGGVWGRRSHTDSEPTLLASLKFVSVPPLDGEGPNGRIPDIIPCNISM